MRSRASTAPGCAASCGSAVSCCLRILTLLALLVGGVIGVVAAGLAVAGAALGLVAERWLFFAEAKHTVMLYYGAEAV